MTTQPCKKCGGLRIRVAHTDRKRLYCPACTKAKNDKYNHDQNPVKDRPPQGEDLVWRWRLGIRGEATAECVFWNYRERVKVVAGEKELGRLNEAFLQAKAFLDGRMVRRAA